MLFVNLQAYLHVRIMFFVNGADLEYIIKKTSIISLGLMLYWNIYIKKNRNYSQNYNKS